MIILPQVLTALMSPWVGRRAQTWGHRPLLLIGFGALPIRGLVFALTADPPLLISLQLLDGISGAVIGVLTALVIADLTRGSGHFNLAQGIIGTASGIGAALSTALWPDGYEFWLHGSISEYWVGGPAWRGDPLARDARDKTIDGEIAKAGAACMAARGARAARRHARGRGAQRRMAQPV
jgi:MFS family permease